MKNRKRPLTLIEVLISFVLASFVIGALLSSLKASITVTSRTKQAEADVIQRAVVQQHLDTVLFSLVPLSQSQPEKISKTPLFLREKEGESELHFFFYHGIDPEPDFCGNIEGILKLKQDHTFCLILNGRETEKTREEVLLRKVHDIQFAFLSQDSLGTFVETYEWEEKELFTPCAVQLTTVLESQKKFKFVFWLPLYLRPILYPEIA